MERQERNNRGYKCDNISLGYSKMHHKIIGSPSNVQVSPIIVLPTPVTGPPEQSCLQGIFLLNKSTPGSQQIALNLLRFPSEVPQVTYNINQLI